MKTTRFLRYFENRDHFCTVLSFLFACLSLLLAVVASIHFSLVSGWAQLTPLIYGFIGVPILSFFGFVPGLVPKISPWKKRARISMILNLLFLLPCLGTLGYLYWTGTL